MSSWKKMTPDQIAELQQSTAHIEQLSALLAAEALGHLVDHKKVKQLLERIRPHCPNITGSLSLISERVEKNAVN